MSRKVVVIGAVALGPKAACRLRRLEPDAEVTMIDRGRIVSYGGCGIPYYLSGDVSDLSELQATSYKLIRDPDFFRDCKGVSVRTRCEATAIDRARKVVLVRDLDTGSATELPYDQLVLATGSRPRRLGVPGEDLPGVYAIGSLEEAGAIREEVTKGRVSRAVVIGAGFIGLEVAEALADMWGVATEIVEVAGTVLPRNLGPDLAAMVRRHVEDKDVAVHTGRKVSRFEGQGKLERVVTDRGDIEADLAVVAAGVLPNAELARAAGLAVSERGGIVVDEFLRTSDPDIYAGGDCVEINNLVTGKPFYLPLGSMANRQGRVIGANLAGGAARFPGAVGSFAVKVFERAAAGAGLTLADARREGLAAESALVIQFDRAHFYPGKELMTLELVFESGTGRVLGIQGFGPNGDALVGRIDAVAAIMAKGATVEDVSNLEVAYSPPFASAMDIVNTLGNVADNILSGLARTVPPETFAAMWADAAGCQVLDCREPDNAAPYLAAYPDRWLNIPQGQLAGRIAEVPADRPIVLVCNTGSRSYEAQRTLRAAGLDGAVNLAGGVAALRQLGVDPAH